MATILILILSLILTAASGAEISPSNNPHSMPATFYDVLKSKGLPIGLFPKGISNFSVDPASGRFEIHLLYPSQCDAKFETNVRYQCNITGSIGYGKIANLSGVAAQELFLWLPVKGIQVDIPSSGLIYFDVGLVYKQFSLSFFETPKDCDAMKDDGGDDVVLFFNDHSRDHPGVVETRSGKFLGRSFTTKEPRAVS